jgi:hypothetical protein
MAYTCPCHMLKYSETMMIGDMKLLKDSKTPLRLPSLHDSIEGKMEKLDTKIKQKLKMHYPPP